MNEQYTDSYSLAASITRASSKQTYYTIRLLVDRPLVQDAYRAYGYFRWVDDVLDSETGVKEKKSAFLTRQESLLAACYRGKAPNPICAEERMLVDLVHNDSGDNPGLQSYLKNMMGVMRFDVERRGQFISQTALSQYSQMLAAAVTDAVHYFIGHNCPPPLHDSRYLAVNAAHITHMLRDTLEDTHFGYYNVPREFLQAHRIHPQDVNTQAYRDWVCGRVQLARTYFKLGRDYFSRVKNARCRLAGYAYAARFEWMLRTIERENYYLRAEYQERKRLPAGLWMSWSALTSLFGSPQVEIELPELTVIPVRVKEL